MVTRWSILLSVLVFGSACAQAAPARSAQERRLETASRGLCDARILASEGKIGAAADVFFAQSHGYLHELAALLQAQDPERTAALLEAKQRVEEALAVDSDPTQTEELIARLHRALGRAATALGLPVPRCPEEAR